MLLLLKNKTKHDGDTRLRKRRHDFYREKRKTLN